MQLTFPQISYAYTSNVYVFLLKTFILFLYYFMTTIFQSSLFNQLADFDNTIFYNRSFVDMLDFRDQNYLSNIPVEYYNSSPSVQFPGSGIGLQIFNSSFDKLLMISFLIVLCESR